MKLTFVVLMLLLGLGLITRKYDGWTRLLLIVMIVAMIVYMFRT